MGAAEDGIVTARVSLAFVETNGLGVRTQVIEMGRS